MTMADAKTLIAMFRLQPHPEGGYFRETYRADTQLVTANGERNVSTAIYYLLPHATKSNFHRIQSDEVWHFYLGGPLTVVEIDDSGERRDTVLGHDVLGGQTLQYVVRADTWFAAHPGINTPYSLVGCTVAPGFDFADFTMGLRADLRAKFPQHQEIIELLTMHVVKAN